MNQKQQKPTLTGQRIKTRKRDEKEKYDPIGFRDVIIKGINEAGTDLEEVSKFLISTGAKLNYRLYSEPLLDILIAGGILAPGGSIVEDGKTKVCRSDVSVFTRKEDVEELREFNQIFIRLIRQYKYLEKKLEDEMLKILMFLKFFEESKRNKLAMLVALLLSTSIISAKCLTSLFNEVLIKEGISLDFLKVLFQVWLKEKDMNSVANLLRKAELEKRLLDFLPVNKRTEEYFCEFFEEAGLPQLVSFQKNIQAADSRKQFQSKLKKAINEEAPIKDLIQQSKDYMSEYNLAETEVIVQIWRALMNCPEWTKKDELLLEQALRHIKIFTPLLVAFTTQAKSELALILKVQEYCYDNIAFLKYFQKIIMLLYKTDVLSEEVILKWYKEAHSAKGKSVFLAQTEKMVAWLEQAEEETSDEEEDDEEEG